MEHSEEIADKCLQIINAPEHNIKNVTRLLASEADRGIVLLSLAKVFKNITPLYKIRLGTEKIKHKNSERSASEYDKNLVAEYNAFIREICKSQLPESFVCACELLKSLDHFNFNDKLVSKVLVGTTLEPGIRNACIATLIDRILNNSNGECVFMIINNCLDYKFAHQIIESLLECKYLGKCVEIRLSKELKYDEEYIRQKKEEKRGGKLKGFFKKKEIHDKKLQKEEKRRQQLQKEIKAQEDQAMEPLEERNYIKTTNALQRLYFTILKEKMEECYLGVFAGLRKYIRIIRREFHEGLYTLVNDAIDGGRPADRLEGISTLLFIYKDQGFDFQKAINCLFGLVDPLNHDLGIECVQKTADVIGMLFIENRQSNERAHAMMQRLVLARCMRYVPAYDRVIRLLEQKYDIDVGDASFRNKKVPENNYKNIDQVPLKPFYEHLPYMKLF